MLGQPGVSIPIPSECNIGVSLTPNTGSGTLLAGVWNRLEGVMQLGSCATCQDGIVVWYLNGEKIGDYRNFNHSQLNGSPSAWNAWALTHTWDGQAMESLNTESWIDIGDMFAGTFPAGATIH
jgi:hypothetical protein